MTSRFTLHTKGLAGRNAYSKMLFGIFSRN